MKHVTKEMISDARNADLFEYLCDNHFSEFIHDSAKQLRFREDRSICITMGSEFYYDFETCERGNGIDFLTKYLGYSFVEAVEALCGYVDIDCNREISHSYTAPCPIIPKGPISLPQISSQQPRRVYAYLTNSRGIDGKIVNELLEYGLLYQDIRNNAVFVNDDCTWAEMRGTCEYLEEHCIYEKDCPKVNIKYKGFGCDDSLECPDCKYVKPFHCLAKNSAHDGYWAIESCCPQNDTAYICEASIDAISLYELHGSPYRKAAYISIGGVSKQAAIDRIKREYKHVILAVDNDAAGEACRKRNPDLEYIIPDDKDWNDDLFHIKFKAKCNLHKQ